MCPVPYPGDAARRGFVGGDWWGDQARRRREQGDSGEADRCEAGGESYLFAAQGVELH